MDTNIISPYVRVAMKSVLEYPFRIGSRIIFDYEIIFVDDGRCRLDINGQSYVCEKGDIIFIRPGVEHALVGIDGVDFVQPHLHFDMIYDENSPKVYVSFCPRDRIPEEELHLIRPDIIDSSVPPVIRLDDPEYFRAQLMELIDIFSRKRGLYHLLEKEKVLRMLHIILSRYVPSSGEASSTNNLIMNVKNYIDGNYRTRITLDTLTKMFYVNKYTLEEEFKRTFGVPVIKYYNRVRLSEAERMLSFGMGVGEVADALCFDNIYAFSRFFKNGSGVSPSKYKAQIK